MKRSLLRFILTSASSIVQTEFWFFQTVFSGSWVVPYFVSRCKPLINIQQCVSVCVFLCVRISRLTRIIISASFRKRVWRSADWPAEGYSVSWIPWGVSGWADLLLAHTCAIRPKDPPALPGLWLGGRHSMSCWLPGGLRQLRWRLGLRWQVRIIDQSLISRKCGSNWICVYYWISVQRNLLCSV